MGKGTHGLFVGTAGCASSPHTLTDNLSALTAEYALSNVGLFGTPASKKGGPVRLIVSHEPIKTAIDFYKLATQNCVSESDLLNGNGKMSTMKDGVIITIRPVSSSPDHSPAVNISTKHPGRIKDQKNRFVKDARKQTVTKTDNTISSEMLDILRSCKGKKLKALLCTGVEDSTQSFELIILRFDEFDLELWSLEQPDKEGEASDIAKIVVKANPNKDTESPIGKYDENGVFHPKDFTKLPVGQTIDSITVHNERVHGPDDDPDGFILSNTYAIVISLGTQYLHIMKRSCWMEIWDVSFSQSDVPTSPEWDESEGATYDITLSSIKL